MPKKKKENRSETFVIGVDLGATKMLAAVVNRKGHILGQAKRKTKPDSGADTIVKRLAKTVREAIDQAGVPAKKVTGVGIGAPAPTDPRTGFVFEASNVPALSNFPLGDRLGATLKRPVFVDNDVNVGTVGEHAWGAGRGVQDMVGIFVGTGVGGGLIVNGQLRHGFRNSAGEIGHMVVGFKGEPDESHCSCGNPGCLEAYASRTAIERDIRAVLAAGRESVIPQLLEQKGRDRITSGVLAAALEQQDPVVTEIMARATTYLAMLVASIVNFFDPQLLVFGGGVAEALGQRLLEPIRRQAPQWYIQKKDADRVRIVLAELGDYAGVLGAATIARRNLE